MDGQPVILKDSLFIEQVNDTIFAISKHMDKKETSIVSIVANSLFKKHDDNDAHALEAMPDYTHYRTASFSQSFD